MPGYLRQSWLRFFHLHQGKEELHKGHCTWSLYGMYLKGIIETGLLCSGRAYSYFYRNFHIKKIKKWQTEKNIKIKKALKYAHIHHPPGWFCILSRRCSGYELVPSADESIPFFRYQHDFKSTGINLECSFHSVFDFYSILKRKKTIHIVLSFSYT